jgi:hypothetical protein
MEEGLCPWSDFMVRLHKKIVLRALGPSLGVNRMWTKNNIHAPKSGGADFFQYMPEKGNFGKIIIKV